MQRDELATRVRLERINVLTALGFSREQIERALQIGVSSGQLRGMLQLRQYEGASAEILADIAARIDRIEEFEKLALDSHTA